MTNKKTLKNMLDNEELIIAPGAYDAMSAILIENAGFPAIYYGSMGATASMLGKPDIGFITRPEYVNVLSNIVENADIPVIADAEDGYGNMFSLMKTIKEYEKCGVSALHLEDHVFGKHIDMENGGECISTDEMVNKIKIALDARENPETLIIARTDSYWAYNDLNLTIERGAAFAEAGADMIFAAGVNKPEEIKKLKQAVRSPVAIAGNPSSTHQELKKSGLNLVLYYAETMLAAYSGINHFLKELMNHEDPRGILETEQKHEIIDDLLNINKYKNLYSNLK